jgi:hypothetical protein
MSDNLEDMKRMAMEAMKNKKSLKAMSKDINQLKDDTAMFVFQKEEVALLEALLFDVLEKDATAPEIYKNEKRTALNMLKHMEAI